VAKIVDESALRSLLKTHGWTLKRRRIKRHRAEYYYAARKIAGTQKVQEVYLCNVADLDQKSEAEILARLPDSPSAPGRSGNSGPEQTL